MKSPCVTRSTLVDFFCRLDATFAKPGRVYLIGETTQVFEEWRTWTTQIEFTAEVASRDQADFSRTALDLSEQLSVMVLDESPADLIPLPEGYETRGRPLRECEDFAPKHLALHHFDPYSVAIRFIARGDEPDYHIVRTT